MIKQWKKRLLKPEIIRNIKQTSLLKRISLTHAVNHRRRKIFCSDHFQMTPQIIDESLSSIIT